MTEPVEESINLVPLLRIEVDILNLSGMFSGGELQNPFEALDTDAPKIAAAVEKCQGAFIGVGPGF